MAAGDAAFRIAPDRVNGEVGNDHEPARFTAEDLAAVEPELLRDVFVLQDDAIQQVARRVAADLHALVADAIGRGDRERLAELLGGVRGLASASDAFELVARYRADGVK